MSQFYEYNWPTPVVNGISLFQTLTANIPLLLNGSYVNKITRTVNFVDDFNIVPRITLNSAANLSGINFLITGYQNGVFISETLAGPNNATVTSVNCFDTLLQIIPNTTSVSTVQVGVAALGYFPMILLNTAKINTSSISYALNMVAATANPATYQVFLSLKNNLGLGKYDDLTSAANGNFAAAAAATASALIQYNSLASNLLIKIGPNNNGSVLKCQFLQL
ncbi:MAG: hypothetical protein H6910_05120 [Rickettsiaceae bacterium]|nr:hypothetical protein [Rickettsiaceae bacterium]MCP5378481.1 hypothetical protein [Rickettsiaceae bacterium]